MTSVYNMPDADVATRFGFTGGGAAFMLALLYLRQRFLWWPLHPIGFPIANTFTIMSHGWLAIFMAWMFKATILRYGGYASTGSWCLSSSGCRWVSFPPPCFGYL